MSENNEAEVFAELLAALKGVIASATDSPDAPDTATCAIFLPLSKIRAAWAAIAKAEGQS